MDIKKVIKCNLSLIFFFLDILKTFWPVLIWVSPRICKKTAFTKRSQFDIFLCWARTLALSANAGTCVITYDPWWLNFKTSYLFFFNIFISNKKWHLPLEKSFTDNLMNNLEINVFAVLFQIFYSLFQAFAVLWKLFQSIFNLFQPF